MPEFQPAEHAPIEGRRPGPRLGDIADQLLFPRIFAAAGAAARPERVIAGGLAVLLFGVVAISLPGTRRDGAGFLGWLGGMLELVLSPAPSGPGGAALAEPTDRARLLLIDLPAQAFADAPLSAGLLTIGLALCWSLPGLFIARGVAMELGRSIHVRSLRALSFLAVRGPSAVAGMFLVPLIALALLLIPMLLGLLLALPGLDVLGALLHGVGLAAAIVSALVLLLWIPGSLLIIPSVAADGADAFDACQRGLGMFIARPLSIGLHLLIAGAQGVVVVWFVWLVSDLGSAMARDAAGLLTFRGRALIAAAGEAPGGVGLAGGLLVFWRVLPVLITAAYAFSYAHAAATAVYLNARRMVDGQEADEIWSPGDAPGVTSAASGDAPDDAAPGSPPPPGSSGGAAA